MHLAGEVRRRIGGEVERGADDLVGVGDATDGDTRRQRPSTASGVGIDAWKLSVWNVPQTIPLTRMPRGPNSCAVALVSVLSPAFAAA